MENFVYHNNNLDDPKKSFLESQTPKTLAVSAVIMALAYFYILAFWFPRGNPILFWLLITGEIFHVWQIVSYVLTVWSQEAVNAPVKKNYFPNVDVFITVTGEPREVVEATARAAANMDYPNFQVYLLNDGKIAAKPNWREAEEIAINLEIGCITRQKPGGAKAGNINHALNLTSSELVVVFDADQAPYKNFLKQTVGYFAESKVGFVQSPQYYKNFNDNIVTKGSWEQQELFFGPICKGKNSLNSAFLCGTNMVIRRQALAEIGGMKEDSIAEDFVTSLLLHEQGWRSIYVPEVLAEGLAPQDYLSYHKQQFRWARGSLEVLFKYNPLFRRGLGFRQKIQYLTSASYYCSGPVVLLNALLPLIFFFTGQVPVVVSTMLLTAVFLPYIFMIILTLRLSSNYSYTFLALSFSMGSFAIQLSALFSTLFNRQASFNVTSKSKLSGNFLHLTIPHLLYIAATFIGIEWAFLRDGLTAPLLTNICWALFNITVFLPFAAAASPWFAESTQGQAQLAYARVAPETAADDKI